MPKSKPRDFKKKKSVIGQKNARAPNAPMVKSKVIKMRDQAIDNVPNEILEALRGVVLKSEKSRSNCVKVFVKYLPQHNEFPPTIITRIISSTFPLITDLSPLVREIVVRFVMTYISVELLTTQLEAGLTHSYVTIRLETLQLIEKIIKKGVNILYDKEERLAQCLDRYAENALKSVTDFKNRKKEEFESKRVHTIETKFTEGQWCGVAFDNITFSRKFVNEWTI
ncbi:Pre-rRNA-processing protein Ipi1 N-terminal domain-containing protein [Entamoeba marina]